MAYADENDIRVLTEEIRDRLRVTDKTEAQALSASAQEGNYGVYYASDTKKIVVGGQKYGGSDYTLPTATDAVKGGIKVALGSIGTPADMSDNYTNSFGVSEDRLVLANATTSYGGAMSASDKQKLDIAITEDNEYFDIDEYKYYSKQYLTFEVVEDGTITVTALNNARTFQYSTDGGTTWVSMTSSNTEQSLGDFVTGDKIMLKGTNSNYGDNSNGNSFRGTAKINVYGNIMSLMYGDNFVGNKVLKNINGFRNLFAWNTNLISAEHLILGNADGYRSGYAALFDNCTSLIKAPKLPATTLGDGCYQAMFRNCTSLTDAPELPATTLVANCYFQMFKGCTSLEKAPELPAKTLVSNCYLEMFYGCSSLNYIKALFTTTPSTSYTNNWVYGVSASGYFIKADDAEWELTGVHGVPTGWTIVRESEWIDDWEKLNTYTISNTKMIKVMYDALPYTHRCLTFRILSDGVITMTKNVNAQTRSFQYSINFGKWVSFSTTTSGYSFDVKTGDIVLWKGVNANTASGNAINYCNVFSSTCEFEAEGNPMSLLWGDEFITHNSFGSTPQAYFANLFRGCTNLMSIENLTFETFNTYVGVQSTFYGCTSIKKSCRFPKTTRFYINDTFHDCVSLEKCTLPYTGVVGNDYYRGCFYGCTSLKFIKMMAESGGINWLASWAYNVPAGGTFVMNSEQTWWNGTSYGTSGVPSGWDVKYCDPDGAKLKVMINYEQAFDLPYDEQSEWNVVMDAGQRLTTNEEHEEVKTKAKALEERVNDLEETLSKVLHTIDKRITLET